MPPSLSPHSHSETPSLLVQSHRQSNSRRHPKLCSVTGPKLSTLSTPFCPRRHRSCIVAQSSALLIFLTHGHKRDTASLHLVLHFFFLFFFLGSICHNHVSLCLCLWFLKGKNENHKSEICVWFVILKGKIIDLIRLKSIPFKMSLKLSSISFITYSSP